MFTWSANQHAIPLKGSGLEAIASWNFDYFKLTSVYSKTEPNHNLLQPYLFPRVTPASLIRSLMQGVTMMGCSSESPASS